MWNVVRTPLKFSAPPNSSEKKSQVEADVLQNCERKVEVTF